MKVEQWDETRDGPLSEAAMRMKLEQRGYRGTVHNAEVVGNLPVIRLDATKD